MLQKFEKINMIKETASFAISTNVSTFYMPLEQRKLLSYMYYMYINLSIISYF